MRTAPHALDAVLLVGRGVFIELIRRKVFYVLLILMALYVLGVLAVSLVGIENASTATFLMNLGLTMAWTAGHAVALVLAARQVPDEIENRTLYPLLARPIGRPVMLFGKWLACAAAGAAVFVVLGAMAWVFVPKLEAYHTGLLFQLVLLQFVSLGMVSGLALLLSLVVPRGVTMVLTALVLLFGSKAVGLVGALVDGGAARSAVDWLGGYVPNFAKLNLITRYTDGIAPLAGPEFLGLFVYGAVVIALCVSLGAVLFERRPL